MRDKKDFYNTLININFSSILVSDSTKIEILSVMNTLTYFVSYFEIFLIHKTCIILSCTI